MIRVSEDIILIRVFYAYIIQTLIKPLSCHLYKHTQPHIKNIFILLLNHAPVILAIPFQNPSYLTDTLLVT